MKVDKDWVYAILIIVALVSIPLLNNVVGYFVARSGVSLGSYTCNNTRKK